MNPARIKIPLSAIALGFLAALVLLIPTKPL